MKNNPMKKNKQEITHSESSLLISEMAEIISHEIRNPMTTVRGFLQMFMDKPSLAKNQDNLQMMIEELDSVNASITEMLSVRDCIDRRYQNGDLNQVIESISPRLRGIGSKEQKFLDTDLHPIPELFMNQEEIQSLILLMCRNSFEAMHKGGRVIIATQLEDDNVLLKIKDEGKGIDPAIVDKIGTPFLTNKEKSFGLGLAVCYSICQRHGAEIKVDTSPKGTTFTIKFPITSTNNYL